MSVTSYLVTNCRVENENYITGSKTITGDTAQIVSDTIPANTTNAVTSVLPFAYNKCELIYMSSDMDLTVLIANAGGNTTVNLTADEPFCWANDTGIDNPFGANNVTGVTATNANLTVNAVLTARILTVA